MVIAKHRAFPFFHSASLHGHSCRDLGIAEEAEMLFDSSSLIEIMVGSARAKLLSNRNVWLIAGVRPPLLRMSEGHVACA